MKVCIISLLDLCHAIEGNPFVNNFRRLKGVRMPQNQRSVFITGGTGYLGRPLIQRLLMRGHEVRALVRPGSESKLTIRCNVIQGNALDASSYASQISPSDTFVQLVGVAHPSPTKKKEFRSIDFVAAREAIKAAVQAGIKHFIYLSVAHPAPAMKAYIEVRSECEQFLRDSGMNATVLRPWYVLGPGHWWTYALLPVYWLFELIPFTGRCAPARFGYSRTNGQ